MKGSIARVDTQCGRGDGPLDLQNDLLAALSFLFDMIPHEIPLTAIAYNLLHSEDIL